MKEAFRKGDIPWTKAREADKEETSQKATTQNSVVYEQPEATTSENLSVQEVRQDYAIPLNDSFRLAGKMSGRESGGPSMRLASWPVPAESRVGAANVPRSRRRKELSTQVE
jgi:hypothetical protein